MPEYLSPERSARLAELRRKYHRLAPFVQLETDIHVASVATCMTLFDVSGWRDTDWQWSGHRSRDGQYEPGTVQYRLQEHQRYVTCYVPSEEDYRWVADYPAYDLSYLLRLLPQNTWVGYTDTSGKRGMALAKTYAWNAAGNDIEKIAECLAETPEDALCLLAIALFRQGRLQREERELFAEIVTSETETR